LAVAGTFPGFPVLLSPIIAFFLCCLFSRSRTFVKQSFLPFLSDSFENALPPWVIDSHASLIYQAGTFYPWLSTLSHDPFWKFTCLRVGCARRLFSKAGGSQCADWRFFRVLSFFFLCCGPNPRYFSAILCFLHVLSACMTHLFLLDCCTHLAFAILSSLVEASRRRQDQLSSLHDVGLPTRGWCLSISFSERILFRD